MERFYYCSNDTLNWYINYAIKTSCVDKKYKKKNIRMKYFCEPFDTEIILMLFEPNLRTCFLPIVSQFGM